MDSAAEQARWYADKGTVWSAVTLEKVVLLGLLSVIFAQTLPGVHASNLQLLLGVSAVVVINAAISLALARRARGVESISLTVRGPARGQRGARRGCRWVLPGAGDGSTPRATLFFLAMICLLTTLHDRWQPVAGYRASLDPEVRSPS